MRKMRVSKRMSPKRVLQRSHIAQAIRETLWAQHHPWRSMAGLAAAACMAMSTHTLAAFPPVVDLAELNGDDGFAIEGTVRFSGESVSAAGDVNGDGIDDVIIGEPGWKYESAGSAVLFGRPGGFPATVKLSDLDGSDGFLIREGGEPEYEPSVLGSSVSNAGDVNDDGIDDVIIGHDGDEVYVVFGRKTGFPATIDLSNIDGSNGFVIKGSGAPVSAAGDVNDDGIDDVIIGGEDRGYMVFGRAGGFPAAVNLSELDGSNGFVLSTDDEHSGFGPVSNAGDVNDDGIDDVIIGAPSASVNEYDNAGKSYVVFGQKTRFPATLNVSGLDGSNGFVINGIHEGDASGASVSDAGDVNGDGKDDVIIGTQSANQGYVVFGHAGSFSAAFNLSDLDGSNGFVVSGLGNGSGAGDVNADGIDDVILNSGQGFYVVYGQTGEFPAEIDVFDLDSSNSFVIKGEDFVDGDGAGDINDDGIDDVIIGRRAGGGDENYVVFGLPKINDFVTFEPDPSTYSFTPDTGGCPAKFVGKFGFEAQLTNTSQSTLSNLRVQVAELSNGNLLLTSNGTIGPGDTLPIPTVDGYLDELLSPAEYVDVPFRICLKNTQSFTFFVNVLGFTSEVHVNEVNSTSDTVDVNPGDGDCADGTGKCTLRAAIMEANASAGGTTISFAPSVVPGTFTLSLVGGDEDAAAGDLDITGDYSVIGGAGASNTILDGNGLDRVLNVHGGSRVEISGVTVQNGLADGGGGILNHGALNLSDSTISSNNSSGGGRGGGIANFGMLVIENSTISDNTVVDDPGGGGGIHTGDAGAMLILTNSTVSGNVGGGIQIFDRGAIISNSTLSNNIGGGIGDGTADVTNTIIADNLEGGDCAAPITSLGHNLDSDGSCNLTRPDDLPNINPLLGPLADNGGPTETHALLAGSPAIDAGEPVCTDISGAPLTTDQRGEPRPVDGNGDGIPACDIGAFELQD